MLDAAYQVQKSSLTGAGLPHDGDKLTRRYSEADSIHGANTLVALPKYIAEIFYCYCIHLYISFIYRGRSTRFSVWRIGCR